MDRAEHVRVIIRCFSLTFLLDIALASLGIINLIIG